MCFLKIILNRRLNLVYIETCFVWYLVELRYNVSTEVKYDVARQISVSCTGVSTIDPSPVLFIAVTLHKDNIKLVLLSFVCNDYSLVFATVIYFMLDHCS